MRFKFSNDSSPCLLCGYLFNLFTGDFLRLLRLRQLADPRNCERSEAILNSHAEFKWLY